MCNADISVNIKCNLKKLMKNADQLETTLYIVAKSSIFEDRQLLFLPRTLFVMVHLSITKVFCT